MMAGSNCDCLICRLEISLIAELADHQSVETFRQFAASRPALSGFSTALELIEHLHRPENQNPASSSDEVFVELLRPGIETRFYPLWQRLFLLVFVPTIHRTTSQIAVSFPLLAREDIAQHLAAVLLEALSSDELRSRRTHLAFVIARMMRRRAFQWAIRESRRSRPAEMDGTTAACHESPLREELSRASILLAQFLDNCQRRGWLSPEERELLTQCKLEGISCPELARRNGHTAIAIQHRIQRLLQKLRRIAQKSEVATPQQMDLFLH